MNSKWLSVEVSLLIIVSVVAVGGFLSLDSTDSDGTSEVSGQIHKKIKRELRRIEQQIQRQTPSPPPLPQPAPQPTPPPSAPQPVQPQPAPSPIPVVPVIPITPPAPQPAPLPCPSVDSRGWECFKRDRYISCSEGFEVAVPLASTSCTFCCMPSQKPQCAIDISNCPPSITRFFTTTTITGEPSKDGSMCTINNNLISNAWNRNWGLYYWKYNAPCGTVLRRN